MIHHDVKPANLFLAKVRGETLLKVLDFGISKAERLDRRRTETKEILGSPWYMAPEQLKSAASADTRSDVWSLGVILFELVTGEVPWDGESMTEVIVKVLTEEVPFGKLPKVLEPVVRKCLAKAPQARFASMHEVAEALRRVLEASSGPTLLDVMPATSFRARSRSAVGGKVAIIPPAAANAEPVRLESGSGTHEMIDPSDVELLDPSAPRLEAASADDDDDDDEGEVAVVDDAELLPSNPPSSVIELDSAAVIEAADDAETPYMPPVAMNAPDDMETPFLPPVVAKALVDSAKSVAPPVPKPSVTPSAPKKSAAPTPMKSDGPPPTASSLLAASVAPARDETGPPPKLASTPPAESRAEADAKAEPDAKPEPKPKSEPAPKPAPEKPAEAEAIPPSARSPVAVSAPPPSTSRPVTPPEHVVSVRDVEDDEEEDEDYVSPVPAPAVDTPEPGTEAAERKAVTQRPPRKEPEAQRDGKGTPWLPIAVVAAILGGVLWVATRPTTNPQANTTPSASSTSSKAEIDPPVVFGTPTSTPSESASPVLVGSAAIASAPRPLIVVPSVEPSPHPAPVHAATGQGPAAPTEAPAPRTDRTPAPTAEDEANIPFEVARKNHASLRSACWDGSEKTTQMVSVAVTVDASGATTSASASSADAKLAQCVESQVKTWRFPSSKTASRSYQIPIRFRR